MSEKAVTVKFLKWETIQVLPQNRESVKALNEKLQGYKGDNLSENQQKLMYSGKILVDDDKASFGLSIRPAVVLMVANNGKQAEDGSLIYVEWPPEKRRSLALRKLSEREKLSSKIKSGDKPPKAESETDKDIPKAESDGEKKLPKAEKGNKLPIVKPNFRKLPPKDKLDIEKLVRELDSLMGRSKSKLDIEKLLPNMKSEKRPLKKESETKKPSLKGEPETKKPSSKADTPVSDIGQPSAVDKLTGQDAFKFIGEFIDIGDGPEFYVLKHNSKDLISLSEDKLLKIMKRKLEHVSNLIMNIKCISPLKSKL